MECDIVVLGDDPLDVDAVCLASAVGTLGSGSVSGGGLTVPNMSLPLTAGHQRA